MKFTIVVFALFFGFRGLSQHGDFSIWMAPISTLVYYRPSIKMGAAYSFGKITLGYQHGFQIWDWKGHTRQNISKRTYRTELFELSYTHSLSDETSSGRLSKIFAGLQAQYLPESFVKEDGWFLTKQSERYSYDRAKVVINKWDANVIAGIIEPLGKNKFSISAGGGVGLRFRRISHDDVEGLRLRENETDEWFFPRGTRQGNMRFPNLVAFIRVGYDFNLRK